MFIFRSTFTVGLYIICTALISILMNGFTAELEKLMSVYGTVICSINYNRFLSLLFALNLLILLIFKLMIILTPNKFNSLNHKLLGKFCDIICIGITTIEAIYNLLHYKTYCGSFFFRKIIH